MNQTPSRSRADRELDLLCDAFAAGRVACIPSGLADVHAACVDAPPDDEPTLAISVGGSNTKLMLARVGQRQIKIIDALAMPNPTVPTPWAAFFRELFAQSPAAIEFLRTASRPRVGVSLAVPIQDGVPHHPSKMPTLTGLVSRAPANDVATHHFGRNLAKVLGALGANGPRIAYQSDGVLAHLGAFFLSDLSLDDRTMLLVCGTGLACATRDEFILCGMACILADDNPITAHHATESGQYQHLIAGKGLWGMMRRSLFQAAAEHNLPEVKALAETFASAADSVRVRSIAAGEAALPLQGTSHALVRRIATDLIDAGTSALANCAIASAEHVLHATSSTPVQLLLEGSIALDPFIQDRLRHRFESVGDGYAKLVIVPTPTMRSPVDVTLVGAAALGAHA